MEDIKTLSYKVSQSVFKGYINYRAFEQLSDDTDGEVPEIEEKLTVYKEELLEKLKHVDSLLGRTRCLAFLNVMNDKYDIIIVKYLTEGYLSNDFSIIVVNKGMIPTELTTRNVTVHGLPLESEIYPMMRDEIITNQSVLTALIKDTVELNSKKYIKAPEPQPVDSTTESEEDVEVRINITTHALRRYVERFRKGVKPKSDMECEAEILELFKHAKLIWATDGSKGILEEYDLAESVPNDTTEYWFSEKDNAMFVLCNNNIKTLYSMDFGFVDSINVQITNLQIEELRTTYELSKKEYKQYSDIYVESSKEIRDMERGITELKSKIKSMEVTMALSKAKMSHSSKMRTHLQESMQRELDKLFKKWGKKQC